MGKWANNVGEWVNRWSVNWARLDSIVEPSQKPRTRLPGLPQVPAVDSGGCRPHGERQVCHFRVAYPSHYCLNPS